MENVSITIHDPAVKQVLRLFDTTNNEGTIISSGDDYHFAKVDIKIADNIPLIMSDQFIHFTIDCSGSMDDICNDKRTKLAHLKFTLKNMLKWLVNNAVNVFITIDAFDSIIHHIVPFSKLTSDNIESINDAIQQIQADALTNIELALKNAKERINSESIMNASLTINEIFLTDGEATQGEQSANKLTMLLDDNFNYTFVGFGDNHDDEMLTALSAGNNGTYRFIDAIEKSSLVYGEILSGIFNLAFDKVTINVEGGEIYNYKTNSWSPTLYVGGLVAEELRTFHLRSKTPDLIKAELYGLDIINAPLEQNKHLISINTTNYADINSYIFRQRVQELLYQSKIELREKPNSYRRYPLFDDIIDNINIIADNDNNNTNNNNNTINRSIKNANNTNKKTIKKQINDLLEQIKQYMENNNMLDDKFLKLLCDDLYVAYKSYDYRYGRKYINARHNSQGAQQVYSANLDLNERDNIFNTSSFRTSSAKDSPYKTPKKAKVMREVSSGTQAEDDI